LFAVEGGKPEKSKKRKPWNKGWGLGFRNNNKYNLLIMQGLGFSLATLVGDEHLPMHHCHAPSLLPQKTKI